MYVQSVAIDENTTEKMAILEINDDIMIVVSDSEKLATVFFGDMDFLVRVNLFVLNTIKKMLTADRERQIFLLQVLEHLKLDSVKLLPKRAENIIY